MKGKRFWMLYTQFAVVVLGVVYVASASLTSVPMALSADEMRQLVGSQYEEDYEFFTPPSCPGGSGCYNMGDGSENRIVTDSGYGCRSLPGHFCTLSGSVQTCRIYQWNEPSCTGWNYGNYPYYLANTAFGK